MRGIKADPEDFPSGTFDKRGRTRTSDNVWPAVGRNVAKRQGFAFSDRAFLGIAGRAPPAGGYPPDHPMPKESVGEPRKAQPN